MGKFYVNKAKQVMNYPGYFINRQAQVFNQRSGKLLTASPNKKGVMYITLVKDGVQHKLGLRRLVAEHFVPGKTAEYNTVKCINGDNTDCRASNLVWTTHQEACRNGETGKHESQRGEKNKNHRLTQKEVDKIRAILNDPKRRISQRRLALEYRVSSTTIQRIKNNISWKIK